MSSTFPQLRLVPSEGDAANDAQRGGEQPDDPRGASLPNPGEAALFKRFAPYVARIGLRLLGRESDVDDLIQEVFFAAFRQRDQLREPAAAKSWLATIAVRTARRQLRRRRLRQFVGLDSGGPALELRDQGMSPEKRALLARIYELLDAMPVDQRLAWTLRYVEGEKLEQVAEKCGCSLATAKRRISAAHAMLQAEINDG